MQSNRSKLGKKTIRRSEHALGTFGKARVISVMNNKGGCGKSRGSVEIWRSMSRLGYNALLIDFDTQHNSTYRAGLEDDEEMSHRVDALFDNVARYVKYNPRDELSYLKSGDILNSDFDVSLFVKANFIEKNRNSTVEKLGDVGIIAGTNNAISTAVYARDTFMNMNKNVPVEEKLDFFVFFRSLIRSYLAMYDYIIIDTAPSMDGNILNVIALFASDVILCPFDSIEAAIGVGHMMNWANNEFANYGYIPKPNVFFAMLKYQPNTIDIQKIHYKLGYGDAGIDNIIYGGMKKAIGGYVCDAGVQETVSRRNNLYDPSGKSNDYDKICEELLVKMYSNDYPNLLEIWPKYVATELEKEIKRITSGIEKMKNMNKSEFKYPNYRGY